MSTATVPTITLNDGTTIPQLGFGVWQVPAGQPTVEAVTAALGAGYRHIDTAQMYGNEAGVGLGILEAGLTRDDVYITSKLNNGFHERDAALKSIDDTLERLGTDHLDLFLIHWPLPTKYDGDFVTTWKALEEIQAAGKAISIGVSNFQVPHLERLAAETDVTPAVNQVEAHPYFLNAEVLAYGAEHGIVTEAWSPLAQGTITDDPVATKIGERVGKSASQVVLRWHLQKGHVIFPKSTTPSRIAENFAIFDFELTSEELASLDALDQGAAGRLGPNPDEFAWIPS
jgi:2,5-diketo-D-gluconate reductase A